MISGNLAQWLIIGAVCLIVIEAIAMWIKAIRR